MSNPVRPSNLYRSNGKRKPYMPFKQVPALQAAAFAAVLRNNLFSAAQMLFEHRLFQKLCLAWAELYSDSVQVPHQVTSTFVENDINYMSVRTIYKYSPAPNLPFVNGSGCMQFMHEDLKFVGMLHMEHVNKCDKLIVQKGWDTIHVVCYVTKLDAEFFEKLQSCASHGSCILNVLLYNFYNETCDI
ncbi:hypothetical protein chmu113 [Choristoneura murinana nucleopolyhedrovirus]|uniref:Uncharacterized protein n=1 Tax=Choristoneura murinana nucleopolyhedrovirus TaxID=1987479 RepID=V9XSS4_9ABAC|nr:hypothetical protein chmu113 [Choristoneura murinana nucleopolyhedrovirus]AHD25599.1 hypothetical protein chmu113 [Choristoneura murinana nucleopolyhedrovirus]BBU37597.1 hypothetical protein [Choristoneura diversana nucleopolyhedrovirus]